MNYLLLIVVGIVAFSLGTFLSKKSSFSAAGKQSRKKQENKVRVLALFAQKEQVRNDDVEHLLSVSDATAERYLNELEKEGKILQKGTTGKSVFYTLK